ncbi:MAG: Flp pilus assembly protein CpaB [Planctomycetota bacterium]|nr:Flp pilus assembly protein CpaB [Planctomycetota bacterium]
MAETVVWNKKLLVASLILAGFAVVMFYLYDKAQKNKLKGETVQVLQWKRSLTAGEEIGEEDVGPIDASLSSKDLKGVIRWENKSIVLGGRRVNRSVSKGDRVYYNDIVGASEKTPADEITPGMRGFTLQVDPNYTPGDMLRVGGRVDVMGMVRLKGKPAKTYTLVQNLRVLAIGGKARKTEESLGSKRERQYNSGISVYRSVTVEVSPTLAEQLVDLMPRIMGKVWLTVRNPTDMPGRGSYTGINPQVESVLSQPLPNKTIGPE